MAFTRNWLSSWILDHSKFKTQPSYVRSLMDDVGERLTDYLYGFATGETYTGFKKLGLITIGTGDGTIPTGTGVQEAINIEGKTIDSKVELITIDADGNEMQLTSKGAFLPNDTWFQGNAVGTGANVNIFKINTGNSIQFGSTYPAFPSGGIILWSGAVLDIPTGWVLCDGDNSTPDLTDRFVVGAGDNYSVDGTGGSATHTLTTAEMPAHTHTAFVSGGTWGDGVGGPFSADGNSGSTGGGGAHENRPPYYALAYIMKT